MFKSENTCKWQEKCVLKPQVYLLESFIDNKSLERLTGNYRRLAKLKKCSHSWWCVLFLNTFKNKIR